MGPAVVATFGMRSRAVRAIRSGPRALSGPRVSTRALPPERSEEHGTTRGVAEV